MPEQYQSALTGPQMDQALLDMANHTSERYAKGTANGAAVPSGTVGYQDNALYYKDLAANQAQAATNAAGSATDAAAAAGNSEAAAINSANIAANSATTATQEAIRAENAADRAEAIVGGQFVSYGQVQGLTDTQKARARDNIGASAGGGAANILDNPWFIAGSVVNQRTATSGTGITSPTYMVDRWLVNNCNYTVEADGVHLAARASGTNAQLIQRTGIPNTSPIVGQTATFSAIIDGTLYEVSGTIISGTTPTSKTVGAITISFFYNANYGYICSIQNSATTAVVITAAKWEIGSTSTLGTDPPANFATELQKCWVYFRRLTNRSSNLYAVATGFASSGTAAYFANLFAATPMKKEPTVTFNGAIYVRSGDNTNRTATAVTLRYNDPIISIGVTAGSGMTQFHEARLFIDQGAYIDFSADV